MTMLPLGSNFSFGRALSGIGQGLMAAGGRQGWSAFGTGFNQGLQGYDDRETAKDLKKYRDLQMEVEQGRLKQQQAEAAAQAAKDQQWRDWLASQGGMMSAPAAAGMPAGPGQQLAQAGGADLGPGMMSPQFTPQQLNILSQLPAEEAQKLVAQQMFAAPKEPKTTDDLREYEFAKQQGYRGSFFDYQNDLRKAGASVSNTTIKNEDYGNIPPGFRLVKTPDGSVQMEPIPGSPAAADIAAGADKKAQATANKQQSADIVTQDIGRALKAIGESPKSTTGFFGDMLKGIGGTQAHNVRNLLDTVEANTAFDRLTQMRAESPTGGALGSITERELALLAATKGALAQSQDQKQIEFNLKRLNNVVLDIVHGEGQGPKRYELDGAQGGGDLKSKYGLE